MSVFDQRERIKRRIWQAMAQSGVNITSLSEDDQTQLVDSIADNMVLELDNLLTEVGTPVVQQALSTPPPTVVLGISDDDPNERIIWEGRPFMSIATQYTLTNERIRVRNGLVSKAREDVELVRVQDVDFTQTIRERVLNVGDILISSHDPTSPTLILNDVANPEDVHELVRRAVLEARKRHGLSYREEM
ncbi:MAG: PH domain-containing protein [Anaerolineales bacterium]|nr:PH domain-containing protein [Anaerolineales bacterium]